MTKKIVLAIFLFIFFPFYSQGDEGKNSVKPGPIGVQIRTNKQTFNAKEPIYLDIKVFNRFNDMKLIYGGFDPLFNTSYIIKDRDGHIINSPQNFCAPVYVSFGLLDYYNLPPHGYFGKLIILNEECYFPNLTDGNYSIKIKFTGKISNEFVFKKTPDELKSLLPNIWQGTAESNEILISVAK